MVCLLIYMYAVSCIVFDAANHIHVSQTAAEIIQEAKTYDLYSRGYLELKVSSG